MYMRDAGRGGDRGRGGLSTLGREEGKGEGEKGPGAALPALRIFYLSIDAWEG